MRILHEVVCDQFRVCLGPIKMVINIKVWSIPFNLSQLLVSHTQDTIDDARFAMYETTYI
jgi:hypothetical protein